MQYEYNSAVKWQATIRASWSPIVKRHSKTTDTKPKEVKIKKKQKHTKDRHTYSVSKKPDRYN